MSHFTVMVIGNNVVDQLAPFQENNMGDCPVEYLEFEDYTEEVTDAWNALTPEAKDEYDRKLKVVLGSAILKQMKEEDNIGSQMDSSFYGLN